MENTVIPNPKESKGAEFMWESVALGVLGPRWDHSYRLPSKWLHCHRGLLLRTANVIEGSLEGKAPWQINEGGLFAP